MPLRRRPPAVLVVAAILLAGAPAAAHPPCIAAPADRPRVVATAAETLLATPVVRLSAHVWLDRCHGAAIATAALRVTVAAGPGAGRPLPARGAAGDAAVTLPGPGAYELSVGSVARPEADAATLRVRVVDAARALPVTLELAPSPLDPPRRDAGTAWVTDANGARRVVDVRRRGARFLTAPLRLEPGAYSVAWRRGPPGATERRTRVEIRAAGAVAVTFAGARVRVAADGLPADGCEYQLVLAPADGGPPLRAAFTESGAWVGDDVPAGPAVVLLRRTPRRDPWSPDDPAHVWRDVYRAPVTVPAQRELALAWSMPNLLAGRPPEPAPWTEVQGQPGTPAAGGPVLEAGLPLVVRGGVAALIDARGRVWRAAAAGAGRATLVGVEPPAGLPGRGFAPLALDALGAAGLAWVADGRHVAFRNASGLFAEALPLYRSDTPYPCHVTGLALLAAGEVAAVGRCRPNAPRDVAVPQDGFLALRDARRWRLEGRRFRPLNAVAHGPGFVVAVGDAGEVGWRRDGRVAVHRNGAADLVAVAVLGPRVVARTAAGALVELPAQDGALPVPLAPAARPPARVLSHCLVARGVAALHAAWRRPYEGGPGPFAAPARVVLHAAGGETLLHDGRAGEAVALACDGDDVWLLVRGPDGGARLERR